MGGSVDAMMRAAGYKDTKTFFKAVEDGKIMANDVLPKFGKELQKMAKEGGALDAVMGKTQANFNRFMNALTEAKLVLYNNGMDDGLNYMFNSLANILQDMKPILKIVGQAFRGFVTILTAGLRLVMAPINMVVDALGDLFGFLGVGEKGSNVFWGVVGAGGTLMLLLSRFKMISNIVGGINAGILLMMRRLALIASPLLVVEDYYVAQKGGKSAMFTPNSVTERLSRSSGDIKLAALQYGANKILIEVKDSEFGKAISASFDKLTGQTSSVTQAETAQ